MATVRPRQQELGPDKADLSGLVMVPERYGLKVPLELLSAATVKTARWCRRVILQNFYGTLIVDALGIALAAAGMINPLLAAFIHVSSELTFILNSTRLLPRFSREG
jgi:hypothetical protein